MPFPDCRLPRRAWPVMATLCAALLAACGGGGSDYTGGNPPSATCSIDEQKATLRSYFDDWYFWYALAPKPSPAAYASVADYFDALLYTGTSADFPSDRWSNFESTESFNRFFGDGQSLGYGVSVAGLEVTGLPDQPLYVRYVEPLSPAATAGVVRGDQVLSMNGRSAAEVIAADDFSALSADSAGQTLTLVLRNTGGDRSVTLSAGVFTLTPVSRASVVTTPLGRKLGYVVMKDMISQSLTPLDNAFTDFRAQGVSDVVLDLRYNGGGLVSVAGTLSSYVGGATAAGKTFATLLYNDKRASNNSTFRFANPASALGVSRVYLLTGRRTCSASEQVINGLRGVGIDVIAIGETTCGKPVGFLPTDLNQCGTTYSVVNFESVNARNEGRYFDGFDATCAVAEDWSKPLGANDEPLLATARTLADGGACPVATARERPMSLRKATPRTEPGERQGMIPR
jgi:carboxyl-terminal processing protease